MRFFTENAKVYIPFSGDLLNRDSIRLFFQKNPWITQIVHLVWTFDGNFDELMKMNFDTTKNLLKVADEFGVKKVIFTSTGAVYGEPNWLESYETDSRLPNTWYGLSKKLTEELIEYYQKNFGFIGITLRFPNVYGVWSKWVIQSFQKNILTSWRIVVYGDGTQSRNFLHISDAVRAISVVCTYEKSDIFNITNPVKLSINNLIDFFQTQYEFEVEYISENEQKVKDLVLSSKKAKELLGFESLQKDIRID